MPDRGTKPARLTADFSNVEERREGGGKAFHGPEGDYLLRVEDYELRSKKDDASSKYLNWRLSVFAPEKQKGKGSVYHITSLKPEALWQLRNFLEDMGLKVPKSTMDIPLGALVAKHPIIGATLEDDEYNNKVKSKITATFKKSQYEETGEEDDDEEAESADTEETEEATADEDLEELELDDL
jgi:hypothetical protein